MKSNAVRNEPPAPTRTQLLRELARAAEARGGGESEHGRRMDDRGGAALALWESTQRGRFGRRMGAVWARMRTPARVAAFAALAFVLGLQVAARPDGADVASLQNTLDGFQVALTAREGELELVRLEMTRLQEIMDFSRRYRIPSDLATAINDIALAEGIAPALAFRLVQVESGFYRRAVSPAGAVGYAQLMPATAFEMDPSLEYRDLFDRDTNLRLGFRYLRQMLDKYEGDLRLALLAYNRGAPVRHQPSRVPPAGRGVFGRSTVSTSSSVTPTTSPSGNSTSQPSVLDAAFSGPHRPTTSPISPL